MKHHIYIPRLGTLRGTLFIVVVMLALCLGLSLAVPARGASVWQDRSGDITGMVTVNGQGAADITVELRQRTNEGGDTLLMTAKTDPTGTYHFANQPSAPNDAFFYVRFAGGSGTLAAWYSFPIIYVSGSQVTVPAVEMGDVTLSAPSQNAVVNLPLTLRWQPRRMGETYRAFVYADGKSDKALLDSGSLGTGTEYTIQEGSLPDGKYEGVVQVRDVVAGYGQSQSRFRFGIGAAAQGETAHAPAVEPEQAPAQDSPASSEGAQQAPAEQSGEAPDPAKEPDAAMPDVQLSLTADKITVEKGSGMVYKLEVSNAGDAAANGVVVTDKLPAGVSVDPSSIKTDSGQVSVDGSTVTVSVGNVDPGVKTSIEIPVSVQPDAGSNLSNQATVTYAGASEPAQSNAYIAQVAAPAEGPPESPPQAPPQTQPQTQPQSQPAAPQGGSAQAPVAEQPAAPQSKPQQNTSGAPKSGAAAGTQSQPATAPKKQVASVPQTGGSFPVVLATILVVVTLLARYLRGLRFRRA